MQLRYISSPALITVAGGDPWAIDRSMQAGCPSEIFNLANAFHAAGRCAVEAKAAFDDGRRRFRAAWNHQHGHHPIDDAAQVRRATRELGAQSQQLSGIAADLDDVAATLAKAQNAAAQHITEVEERLRALDDVIGQAVRMADDPHLTAADHDALNAFVTSCEDDAIRDTRAALSQLRSIRDLYSDFLHKSLAALRAEGYLSQLHGVDTPAFAPASVPLAPPGTSAADVHRWWKSLSVEQRDQLVAQHPPELGNLNGIPVDARSQVNEAVMNEDLRCVESLAERNGSLVNDILGDPGKYGLSADAVMNYHNAVQARDGLARAAAAEDARGRHPPAYLMKYQPDAFGGAGVAAIAIGNPDTAPNTAILVKGLGTSMQEGTLSNPDGVRVFREANRADWNRPTAVVLWVGHDTPNTVFDWGLYEPTMARTAGRLLAVDVAALRVTHDGPPTHMTVVGQSYGSTVVSDAAAVYGMRSNDVVLVGSPGTDLAHSAADFHVSPGGHLYVGAASGDAVTWAPGEVRGPGLIGPALGGLGDDPAVDSFGSTRFKSENPHYTANPIYDHSHYFDPGSESLFAVGDVVSGHGDALERDGMTARHRGEYRLPGWFDPEAARPATIGHHHLARVR